MGCPVIITLKAWGLPRAYQPLQLPARGAPLADEVLNAFGGTEMLMGKYREIHYKLEDIWSF